jgi:hypothetical protein
VLGSARSVLIKKASTPGGALPGSALALFNLNENTGTTAADSSGNNHPATLGSGGTWATGHTGSALSNTTANIGAKSSVTCPSDVVTIMAWVKPLDLTASTTRVAFGFYDAGLNTGCSIYTQRADFGTANVLQGDIRIGGSLKALNAPSALTVGTWTHLALTYDGTTAILYKDGVSVASVTSSGTIGQGDALCIAGGMADGDTTSQCVVDDVRVYHAALTQAQIVTGMNTPV